MRRVIYSALAVALIAGGTVGCTGSPDVNPVKPKIQKSGRNPLRIASQDSFNLRRLAEGIQHKIAGSWPYVGQVWKGADFSSYALVVTDGSQVYELTTEGLRDVPLRELDATVAMPSREDAGQYSVVKLGSKSGLLTRVSDSALAQMSAEQDKGNQSGMSDFFREATAQTFRIFIQEPTWNGTRKLQRDQTLKYPLVSKPRLYRGALMNQLALAYIDEGGRDGHLAVAKYWLDQAKAYAPEDVSALRYTDVIDGAGAYVAEMADAYASLGHDAEPQLLRDYFRKRNIPRVISAKEPLTVESEELGKLAGLLADAQGVDWQGPAARGIAPAESLLKGVKYEWQKTPEALTKEVEAITRARNAELATTLDLFLRDVNRKDKALLIIPGNALQHRYKVNGYYRHADYSGQLWNQFTGQFRFDSGTLKLLYKTIGMQDNTFRYIDGMTQEDVIAVVPLWDQDYTVQAGKITLKTGLLQGAFQVKQRVDQYGRKLFVADQAAPGKSLNPITPLQEKFLLKDIQGHWAEATIRRLAEKGVISGYQDGTFRPDARITRAEFVKYLVDALHVKPTAGKIFEDTKGHWAKDAIATANGQGIADGVSDTQFAPDDPITRQEIAMMLVKALKLPPKTIANPEKRFADAYDISWWARESVYTAVAHGILSGDKGRRLHPTAFATRAEAVTMLANGMK